MNCINNANTISSLPLPNLQTCTRQSVLDYFNNTWALTETLFSSLKVEDAYYRVPYHQLRHPMIFYYGHPAIFYINKCRLAGLMDKPVNPYFEELFAIGVDEMSWDDMSKNHKPWPNVSELISYRKEVYETIKQLIETHPALEELPITHEHPMWVLFMCFEHERIHIETSSVLIRELPIELVRKPDQWPEYYPLMEAPINHPQEEIHYPRNTLIDISKTQIQIGKSKDWPTYGWDNEYGRMDISVEPFRASKFLISNGEFLEFVKNGGYEEQKYWTEEGWGWRKFRDIKFPTFWVPDQKDQYKLRLCFDIVPMQWSWPVDVNCHEAHAYCAWRSEYEKQKTPYRLIMEAEHHCLRGQMPIDPVMFHSGSEMQIKKININLAYASQTPVDANTPSELGFHDTLGNSWEWSDTHFFPLPGFKTHHLYDDFSTPCFDGKHNMILGGSFISTGDEASKWARFHFRRHFFQHAGFRIAQTQNLA